MAITKYATATQYGYGFFGRGSGYNGFYSKLTVIAKSKDVADVCIAVDDDDSYGRIHADKHASSSEPLYIVFDGKDNCWKEYFTGLPVETCVGSYCSYGSTTITVDESTDMGSRTLSVGLYTIHEQKIETFSSSISKYSESQIKYMVSQIYALQEAAVQWGKKVDTAIEQAKKERAAKEVGMSSVESGVASGFGKYAMGQSSSEGKTESPKDKNHPKKEFTEQEKLQFIRLGRCAYCGGEFKGLFTKVCKECGKTKNYR